MSARAEDAEMSAMQARLLLDLAGRLGRGEPPLPTDVMAPLVEELTARADEEAIAEAWALQGGHIQHRAGRFRLLYQVEGRTILLVAVTGGPV